MRKSLCFGDERHMTGNRPHSLHRRLRVHEAIPATTSALERLHVFQMEMSFVESNLCKSQAESLADGAAFFRLSLHIRDRLHCWPAGNG